MKAPVHARRKKLQLRKWHPNRRRNLGRVRLRPVRHLKGQEFWGGFWSDTPTKEKESWEGAWWEHIFDQCDISRRQSFWWGFWSDYSRNQCSNPESPKWGDRETPPGEAKSHKGALGAVAGHPRLELNKDHVKQEMWVTLVHQGPGKPAGDKSEAPHEAGGSAGVMTQRISHRGQQLRCQLWVQKTISWGVPWAQGASDPNNNQTHAEETIRREPGLYKRQPEEERTEAPNEYCFPKRTKSKDNNKEGSDISSSASSPVAAGYHPPAEEYETVLSKSHFKSDYEEPTDSSEGARLGGLVDVFCLVQNLLERLSSVAASVKSVAMAQNTLNQQLGCIVTRLEALELKRDEGVKNAQMKTRTRITSWIEFDNQLNSAWIELEFDWMTWIEGLNWSELVNLFSIQLLILQGLTIYTDKQCIPLFQDLTLNNGW